MDEWHCESCQPDMPLLNDIEIQEALSQLTDWRHDKDGACLHRTFTFKGYYKTMAFANAIAWIAHTEKHHPVLEIHYSCLHVKYQTHEAGGITKNDVICAAKIDAIANLT